MISVPVWQTASGNIGSYTTTTINIVLSCLEQIFTTTSTNVITVGPDASRITSVLVNNVSASFTIDNQTIVLTNNPAANSSVIMTLTPNLSYSILNGQLPNGLSLSNGTISGTALSVQGSSQTFSFTIRCSNAYTVRDRAFEITINNTQSQIQVSNLPTSTVSISGRTFYDLGTYNIGQNISYSFDAYTSDNAQITYTITNEISYGGNISNHNPQLSLNSTCPPELKMYDNWFTGLLLPTTGSAQYYFDIVCTAGNSTFTIPLTFGLLNDVGSVYAPPNQVFWQTNAGNIGSLNEGEISYLSIGATTESNLPATLSVSPHSNPLPSGLVLNPDGRITGKIAYGSQTAINYFTIRASSGNMFVDRTFSINVSNMYSKSTIFGISLKLVSEDKFNIFKDYDWSEFQIYRQNDSNYGIGNGSIYLIDGLDSSIDLKSVVNRTTDGVGIVSYYEPFQLYIGEHDYVQAFDAFGNLLYDVIYRKLYDTQTGSGGFTYEMNPVPSPVLYNIKPGHVYPVSLRNIREDLISNIGFAGGAENLPRWLENGFIACLPIAFVLPGTAVSTLDAMKKSGIFDNGLVCEFNRLYLSNTSANFLQLKDNN